MTFGDNAPQPMKLLPGPDAKLIATVHERAIANAASTNLKPAYQMRTNTLYQIRHVMVRVSRGRRFWDEALWIAYRRVSVLGLLSWWWPVKDWQWRKTAQEAESDAGRDAGLRGFGRTSSE